MAFYIAYIVCLQLATICFIYSGQKVKPFPDDKVEAYICKKFSTYFRGLQIKGVGISNFWKVLEYVTSNTATCSIVWTIYHTHMSLCLLHNPLPLTKYWMSVEVVEDVIWYEVFFNTCWLKALQYWNVPHYKPYFKKWCNILGVAMLVS